MYYSLAQYLISMTLGLKWRHQSHLLSWSWTSEEHRKSGNRASSSSSTGFEYIAALQYSALWEVTKYRNNATVKLKPATLLKAQLGACPTKAHLRFELWFGYLQIQKQVFLTFYIMSKSHDFCRSPNSLCMGFTFLMNVNTSKYFYNHVWEWSKL